MLWSGQHGKRLSNDNVIEIISYTEMEEIIKSAYQNSPLHEPVAYVTPEVRIVEITAARILCTRGNSSEDYTNNNSNWF